MIAPYTKLVIELLTLCIAKGIIVKGTLVGQLVVLPIDIENPYRLSNCLYRYISGSWQLIFSDLYRNLPGGR